MIVNYIFRYLNTKIHKKLSKIINISEASSIAIHSLAIIADAKTSINVNKLSELTKFSKNHISKIMQILVRNGYLVSERGPKGGFVLNISDSKISLLEIIELIEGVIEEKHCRIGIRGCPFDECVFGGLPEKLTREFRDYFANRKISDLKTKQMLQLN